MMNATQRQLASQPQIQSEASRFELESPEPVQLLTLAVDVLNQFSRDDTIMAIPVINELLQPVGLITRRKTLAVFGHKFSYELNSRKTVEIIMEKQPLIFDSGSDIEAISRAMTKRDSMHAFDPAIMTLNGEYCGLLSVITLLKRMTDIRIELALDSNPLSRLPGNNSINQEVDHRLQQNKSFMLCYIDIDSFKAFNDYYGYERGDRVIQVVAGILKDVSGSNDFVGHIGGDDFVMLLEADNWRSKAELILQYFSTESILMYQAEDRERGYIIAESRQGQQLHFDLMSLSMAVVPCESGLYSSHIAIAEVACEVKHQAKHQAGNSIVVNRRIPQTSVHS